MDRWTEGKMDDERGCEQGGRGETINNTSIYFINTSHSARTSERVFVSKLVRMRLAEKRNEEEEGEERQMPFGNIIGSIKLGSVFKQQQSNQRI